MKKILKISRIVVIISILAVATWYTPWIQTILIVISGSGVSLIAIVLASVVFKDTFAHDPGNPHKIAWMIQVSENHSTVIQRGGRPMHVLRGDEGPFSTDALFGIWMWYKEYVMRTTGYHVYFPFFTGPTVYDLPRYRVKEENGKKVYRVVEENDPGYRSNHVRTEVTTWYFEYAGAEIQKIPFTIKGSVQIKITNGKEEDALYKTDSWNVLLDQALNSVIRAVVRRHMTLDMVIGDTGSTLRGSPVDTSDPYGIVARLIMDHLGLYAIDGVSLDDLGIEIERADIIDFEDELESEGEKQKLRQAIFAREEARGIALRGEAEAEAVLTIGAAEARVITKKGTATSSAQEKLAKVHAENPAAAEAIINADATRAFATNGGGILDALVASFLKGSKK